MDTQLHDTPFLLLLQNSLELTDLFLNFTCYLFTGAFCFQFWIIAEFPGDFLKLTLYIVKLAFSLVLRTVFHGIPPIGF